MITLMIAMATLNLALGNKNQALEISGFVLLVKNR